jgi:hypothetical protein
MLWSFSDDPEGHDDCGGKMTICFTSNKGGDVFFEWSNYHNGYYGHSIVIGDLRYYA